ACHATEPSDAVSSVTDDSATVSKTQSEGSEFGSRDGYEHVLMRFAPARSVTSGSSAIEIAVMSQTICVSAESNCPGADAVSMQYVPASVAKVPRRTGLPHRCSQPSLQL